MAAQNPLSPRGVAQPLVTVFKATRRHLEGLLPLLLSCREVSGRRVDGTHLLEWLGASMSRREGKLHVIVAREGRFPVGYVMGVFCLSPSRMDTVFWVQEVYVDKPYRGGRVLRNLYHWTRNYASDRGAAWIETRFTQHERRLRALGDSLRFEPTGEAVFELDLRRT